MAVFPSFAKMYLNITDVFMINGVIGASGIGIAIGAVLYSRISRHYIEVGTIPLASFGMALTLYISTIVQSPFLLGISFLLFGVFGGMFVVPLNALIQFNAKKRVLGTILAGNNWFHSLSMFLMLSMTTVVSYYDFDPLNTIYLILLITIIGTLYTVYKLPQSLILLFLKTIVGFKYKLEVNGVKNIPPSGGVLLLGNHISWIDWAVVLMAVPREVKFVMDKTIYNKWYLKWLLKMFKAIPISNASSKSTIQIIAKELDAGHMVVVFPEGSITRNGHLGEFKRGFEKVLELTTTDVRVIPFYIRGLWESMFSRANKKFKKSNRTSSVSVSFSRTLKKDKANIISVKQEVINLSVSSWHNHIENLKPLNETIFDRLKEVSNEIIFADSTGLELSGYKFLTVSILFKNLLKNRIKGQNIGLLMPSTVAGAFINYTVLMMGKTAVNLNYTSEIESIKQAINSAQIKTLFSSGSEGIPKGIELSGDNILGNSQQIANIINVSNEDIMLGSLPLFHAFGIVVTTYLPLIEGIKCVAHPDPTDGLGIAKLVFEHKATIMCGTSTFYRLYTKNTKIHPLMFESLRLVVSGAEKLREDVRVDFKKRFGKDILEGYGTTETSPVAACNLPDVIAPDYSVQIGQKPRSVGMAIPGTIIKIVDALTFKELSVNEEGMILISGIQVMKTYLNNEEKAKEVIKIIKGRTYYITGDKGRIDEDGFLTIVDRYSRFAKLAGEMISLSAIEDKIANILDLPQDSLVDFIATNIEDDKKGEKIILLISGVNEEFILNLKEKILKFFDNKLMIPSSIKIVQEVPRLGSGKKDFSKAKFLAME
jgi:1-acyl-sn-glycerol-3-phosphate acyltransferase